MRRLILCLLLSSIWFLPANALPRIKAEHREYAYDAVLPECKDGAVTGLIAKRFAERETNFWASSLVVNEVSQIKQSGFRPNGFDLIPRRYCTASVRLSNHKKHRLDYIIVEDAGIIGLNYGVEWCISGLDRNYAYDGGCRAARP
jgi:hypothetical protein